MPPALILENFLCTCDVLMTESLKFPPAESDLPQAGNFFIGDFSLPLRWKLKI